MKSNINLNESIINTLLKKKKIIIDSGKQGT